MANSSPDLPLFGALASKEIIYFLNIKDEDKLKAILRSAPENLMPKFTTKPTRPQLLAEVIKLRQAEETLFHNPEAVLKALLSMTPVEVMRTADRNPRRLRADMRCSLAADKSLQPREIPDGDNSRLAAILSAWKISSLMQIMPQPTPRALPDDAPPLLTRPPALKQDSVVEPVKRLQIQEKPPTRKPRPHSITSEHSSTESRPVKKSKPPVIPKGFTIGEAASTEKSLRHYPGKGVSTTSLAVDKMMGPTILANMIRGGSDTPTYLTRDYKHFRRTVTGSPTASEMEALTLGRMIHLEMLAHESPKVALEQRPSLEVGLRRLYAILHVEQAMNTHVHTEPKDAWLEIVHIMEYNPMGGVHDDEITKDAIKRLTGRSKRMSAIKTLTTARSQAQSSNAAKKFPPKASSTTEVASTSIGRVKSFPFPLYPNLLSRERNHYTNEAIFCINSLFFGPTVPIFPPAPINQIPSGSPPFTAANSIERRVRSHFEFMSDTRAQEQVVIDEDIFLSADFANISRELPSPSPHHRGSFAFLDAERISLPKPRPEPDPKKAFCGLIECPLNIGRP